MIKTIVFAFIFFALQNPTSKSVGTESKISSVVIYPKSALITKSIGTVVNRGENLVKLSGLTANLLDRSVQVEIVKGEGVKIYDVKVEETYLEKPEIEKVNRLKAKIDSLNDLINQKQGEFDVVLGKIEFLKNLSPALKGQGFTITNVESYFKFYAKNLNESIREKVELEKEINRLKLQKKVLEDELSKISAVKERGKNVEIYLVSDSKTDVELRVSYLVSSAGWFPGYEVRANSSMGEIDFNFFAFARQFTGEDWSDVLVEVSTAQVAVSGMPPEISQWNVDVYQPKPVPILERKVPKVLGEKEEFKAEVSEAISGFVVPEVEESITSVNFKLRKLNLPSDNQPHKLFLSSFSQPTSFVYYAVPKFSRYAYLRTSLKNDFDFPLLPGEAKIFIDGKYVSTLSLKKFLPGETFDLYLGVDEGVKVERRLKRKFTEYTGAFNRNKKISYEYDIEIENGKARDITIEVKDNFPVSMNEKIKVVLESPSGKEAEVGADGIVTWKINLKRGEKKVLTLKFYVEHPKDLEVVGLE